jgi:hypothetical protein
VDEIANAQLVHRGYSERRPGRFGPALVAGLTLLAALLAGIGSSVAPDPSMLAWSDPMNVTGSDVGQIMLAGGDGPAEVVWWAGNETVRVVERSAISGPDKPFSVENITECVIPVNRTGNECGGLIAASAYGREVVGFRPDGEALQIFTRGPGDLSFAEAANLVSIGDSSSLLVTSSDRVYLASTSQRHAGIVVRLSTDGGLTFGAAVDVSLAGKGATNPRLALGPAGRIGACWEDYRNGPFSGFPYVGGASSLNPDIFASLLDPDLATVSRPIRVDDTLLNSSHQLEPACTFLPDGRMLVDWSDDRVTFYDDFDLYGALSDANVSAFGTSARLDDAPPGEITHQRHPLLAADRDGNAYTAFMDDRDFSPAAWYAHVLTNATAPAALANHLVVGSGAMSSYGPSGLDMSVDGVISLAWSGQSNVGKVSFARAYGAGGDRIPTCALVVPALVDQSAGNVTAVGAAFDADGMSTLSAATIALDGSPLALTLRLPYFSASFNASGLAAGAHNLTATVADRTGSVGACSATLNVAASSSGNHAPILRILSPVDGTPEASDFAVSGEASDADGDTVVVSVSVDGGPWATASGSSQWSLLVNVSPLAYGNHVAAVIASDGALSSDLAMLRFSRSQPLPVAPPFCSIVFPPNGATVATDTEVIGRAVDPDGPADIAHIDYRGISNSNSSFGNAAGTNPFIFPLTGLVDMEIQVNVTVFDREGNIGECGAHYAVVAPGGSIPTIMISSPPAGSLQTGNFTVTGTAASPDTGLSRVVVAVTGTDPTQAQGTASWSFQLDAASMSPGSHTISAFAVDINERWSSPAHVTFVASANGSNGSLIPWILSADSLSIVSGTAQVGTPLTYSVSIRNLGNLSAENLSVDISAAYESDPGGPRFALSSIHILALSGGSPYVIRGNWTPLLPGNVTLRARINADGHFPSAAVASPEANATIEVAAQGTPHSANAGADLLIFGLLLAAGAGIVGVAWYRLRKSKDDGDSGA